MLFLPTSLSPNSVSIDATLGTNNFTWICNGDSQTDYKLQIYRNDTSVLAYDSGKITSSISQHILPSGSLTNSVDFKYIVTVYSGANSIVSEYVFIKCNLLPVISMSISPIITTQSATFTATYNQVDNIAYNSFRFVLYDASNNIITDSGKIFNYNITYSFIGFVASTNYQVECITESAYGIIATTGKQAFTVNYQYPDAINSITGTPLDSIGGLKLDWSSIIQVLGVVSGTSSYVAGKFNQGLYLNPSSSITYNQTVPTEFTLNFWVKLPTGFSGDIVTFGANELIFGYNGTRFYLNYNGSYIHGNLVSLPTIFFNIAIKPDHAIIITSTYTEYVI